ncbi:MAG: hypothetical protein IPK98_18785 [Chloracidobacterium sp.]|nr:hypothetical protein [Chloracidobacterium sp.]
MTTSSLSTAIHLGDEMAEHDFDVVILPIGGGGLISGTIQSFARNGCTTEILGAEPLLAKRCRSLVIVLDNSLQTRRSLKP